MGPSLGVVFRFHYDVFSIENRLAKAAGGTGTIGAGFPTENDVSSVKNMKQLSLLELARLSNPDVTDAERIEQIATDTIAELAETPPVSLEVVASYRGIKRIDVHRLPVAGMLAPEGNDLVMHLHVGDSKRRRRFTGFHEVGHSFQPGYAERPHFRCPAPRSRSDSSDADPEALADYAAAELLLPAAFFEDDIASSSFGLEAVCELADTYEASVQATAYRYLRYWPEPLLLLVLEPGLRKSEYNDPEAKPRLRVKSVHARGRWPFIPLNKSAADDGILARAANGELVVERADLSDLQVATDGRMEVSARPFTYYDSDGGAHERVMAMYRPLATRQPPTMVATQRS